MLDRVLSYVRHHRLMRPGDRVGVAVSGGADSVALLRLLLEAREQLGIVLSVVHFNHKIRGAEAEADEAFVGELARRFDLEFRSDSDDTPAYARDRKLSLEAAARDLRYRFFKRVLYPSSASVPRKLDKVATAHTRDDQAETVLLRFLRGAGTKGLAGIHPAIGGPGRIGVPGEGAPPIIVRPLLEVTRQELREYLGTIGQGWREDASNQDITFARNRLRHEIMPLLRQLNPNLDQVLSGTAEVARAEESWWTAQAEKALQEVWARPPNLPPRAPGPLKIRVQSLLRLPVALQRRVVRLVSFDAPLDFQHIEAILALAAGEPARSEKAIELPDGWEAVRQEQELWLRRGCLTHTGEGYSVPVCIPGECVVAGRKIRASLAASLPQVSGALGAYAGAALLDPELAKSGLVVRSWRAGDRYQPAHTAAPKKLKELLQARHIPRAQKPFWPVVVSGETIVWVPGFPPPEQFQVRHAPALLLEEVPLQPEGKKGP